MLLFQQQSLRKISKNIVGMRLLRLDTLRIMKDPQLYTELNNAITQVQQSDWYYNEKAYIDFATGLPNKNKCEEKLTSHFAISKPTACFMLDLNDLKKVNDTLGPVK